MKKIFYLIACIAIVSTAVIVSCSEDKDTPSTDVTPKSKVVESSDVVKSEVPRDRFIYSAFGSAENLTLDELIDLYKKDISTADSNYLTNLKNMWFAVLKNRLIEKGTEEQKLFFINEFAGVDNNLAYFNEFYNMLATSKLLNRSEKENLANTYYAKNLKTINEIQWSSPDDKKKKESELTYSKRIFTNLANTQK